MSARRPKLPPLVRYQVDLFDPVYRQWMQHESAYIRLKDARRDWRSEDYTPGTLLIIRRIPGGRILWRNKAAKEAGL